MLDWKFWRAQCEWKFSQLPRILAGEWKFLTPRAIGSSIGSSGVHWERMEVLASSKFQLVDWKLPGAK
jgi:hypothetical protein